MEEASAQATLRLISGIPAKMPCPLCSPSPEADRRRKVQRRPFCNATFVQPQLRLNDS